jgi:hypothetical protein
MATIQIRGVQIQNDSIGPTQIDETATYDFSSGVVSVATPSASAHAATKAYVDGQIGDGFQAGDGIDIDTATSPDTIAVDLATNPGLQFTSNKLDLKIGEASLVKDGNGVKVQLKTESGGTISVDSSGIFIDDAAIGNAKLAGSIANAKLANSTISGVALGTNLNSLSSGNGITMTSYNGSAAVSDITINLDGSTLAVGADGIKVADLGVDSGQIAADAIVAGKIADGAVDASSALVDDIISPAKLTFGSRQDVFSPDGSTSAFVLANEVNSIFDNFVMVFKNGLLMRKVASNPADVDQYTVSTAAGTTTVTFGANLSSDDTLEVRSLA